MKKGLVTDHLVHGRAPRVVHLALRQVEVSVGALWLHRLHSYSFASASTRAQAA